LITHTFLARTAQWIAAATVAGLGAFWMLRLQRKRSQRQRHVERLAAEIVQVAQSIEVDLRSLPLTSEAADLGRRGAECRTRAKEVAAGRRRTQDALDDAIGQLHEDHRRIVDLRWELDAVMAERRTGKPAPRSCKFATGSKPTRSRWATTGLHTRPSTLG
jgi:hypothetical protein